MWEIIDKNGTIYSGSEEEMKNVWNDILSGAEDVSWSGDLRLIEVHGVYK